MDVEQLIKKVKAYNRKAKFDLIRKAYLTAFRVHSKQKRVSGEPFIIHPLETAMILAGLHSDSATIAAALLHDCLEDGSLTLNQLTTDFGEEIAHLVEGVTKIKDMGADLPTNKAETIRKIILASIKDVRVLLIKLADRLHNMRTLKSFKPEKQQRIARETIDIYAQIAHKLGINSIKQELEDLSMRYLWPEVYQDFKMRINKKREEREEEVQQIIKHLDAALRKKGVKAKIYGRAKGFYAIFKKMMKKRVEFNEIFDITALRLIAKTIPDCYTALGVVHQMWKPMPGKFKDYIAVPKSNGYQSLHTVVVGKGSKIHEVQIRTEEMDRMAEDGVAAHWRYKEVARDKYFERKINWIKQVLDWKQQSESAQEFIDTLKVDLFKDEIVVFTPKGDPVSLPEKSTPIDFAYEVHTEVGNKAAKAMVNNKLVPLDTILKSGDIVQILTAKNAKPSRQWLKFVVTNLARSKIRSKLGITTDYDPKKARSKKQAVSTGAELLNNLVFEGKQSLLKLSKCCSPQYGDKIMAFKTKDGKITVHKASCPNIHALKSTREVPVAWKLDEQTGTVYEVLVSVDDRIGMLADLLNIISSHNINVLELKTKTRKKSITNTFKLELQKFHEIRDLLKDLKRIRNVLGVEAKKL
ncbi:bifunctional (p)ppGpp synthetase/guanosine-3',5'-bis(diphosphate) 3'-pyrophosphohydrolase [Candidatus Woesearchaeota archaeon]|nr:bifunctional (p)ppGpp synthetase/guanosine-3',5'-bis(diphosphate) 3'-pyrophosphohydrolase [Candidatus Woesearchaeota archaeon]